VSNLVAIIPLDRPGPALPHGALTDLGGRPLLAWTLAAAAEAAALDDLIVAGADPEALAWARGWGARAMEGPLPAAPTASVENALHVLQLFGARGALPDTVALLSASLPLRRPGRVEEACIAFRRARAESLLSVCEEAPCFWCPSPGGLIPLYDHQRGRAHASGEPWLRENGSLYLALSAGLVRHRQRLFGRIATLEMDWTESVRADDPAGLAVCRALLDHVRTPVPAAAAAAAV
jgi:CMP-N,N'-diacetyllegionaminic acid synthase